MDTGGYQRGILINPGGFTWWILVDPNDGYWWHHMVDPGVFTWWILVDLRGESLPMQWWILGGSQFWILVNPSSGLWLISGALDLCDGSWWILVVDAAGSTFGSCGIPVVNQS